MHCRCGGEGRGDRGSHEQHRAPTLNPHEPEKSEVGFSWGDMFYDKTLVEIIQIIVEIDEGFV